MAEHKSQCSPEHRLISLLKAGILIERQDFMRRGQLPVRTPDEALDLRPVNVLRSELFLVEQSGERAYCARHSPEKHRSECGVTQIHFAI